jgi:hypothetical protein
VGDRPAVCKTPIRSTTTDSRSTSYWERRLGREVQEAFLSRYLAREGSFWRGPEEDESFDLEAREDLRFTLQLELPTRNRGIPYSTPAEARAALELSTGSMLGSRDCTICLFQASRRRGCGLFDQLKRRFSLVTSTVKGQTSATVAATFSRPCDCNLIDKGQRNDCRSIFPSWIYKNGNTLDRFGYAPQPTRRHRRDS